MRRDRRRLQLACHVGLVGAGLAGRRQGRQGVGGDRVGRLRSVSAELAVEGDQQGGARRAVVGRPPEGRHGTDLRRDLAGGVDQEGGERGAVVGPVAPDEDHPLAGRQELDAGDDQVLARWSERSGQLRRLGLEIVGLDLREGRAVAADDRQLLPGVVEPEDLVEVAVALSRFALVRFDRRKRLERLELIFAGRRLFCAGDQRQEQQEGQKDGARGATDHAPLT